MPNSDSTTKKSPQSSNSKPVLIEIRSDYAGQRLDNYLITYLKGVPKSHIYRIIRKGEVRVNKGRKKADYRLQAADVIRIPPIRTAEPTKQAPLSKNLREILLQSILYEDSNLLILNKPVGLAVHGGSGIQLGLIEAMRVLRDELHFLELVHRLDRETSGCLVLAKKRSALRALHESMRENQWQKRYLCLVQGEFRGAKRLIDRPLLKNVVASGERIVRVHPSGKPARTKFAAITTTKKGNPEEAWSLLQADLLTGRTHQIRVHCQSIGHPIACDERYGDKAFSRWARGQGLHRMFLHAHRLRLRLPGNDQRLDITAPLDNELLKFMTNIGCNSGFNKL